MVIIYVEGDGDKSFFSYFLKHHLPIIKEKNYKEGENYKIKVLDGKGNIKDNKEFEKEKEYGNDIHILLDADNDADQKKWKQYLENLKNENFLDDYFFIEPQLEMFLLNSLSTSAGDDDNNNFLACIAEYERCIQKTIPQKEFLLSSKPKIHAYVEAKIFPENPPKKIDIRTWQCFNYNKQYFNELKNFLSKAFSSSDVL